MIKNRPQIKVNTFVKRLKEHFQVYQLLTTESPFKMMKNVFYFVLKALFVHKIFKFLS